MAEHVPMRLFHETQLGQMYLGDSCEVLPAHVAPHSVDLIMTSPPFGLVRKKQYGNADADEYLDWFRPFAEAFRSVLKPNGSLVIDIGGSWIPGQPTRSLYHFKLLVMLCEEFGFNLAQEFYWWSPSRLPTPAEWVTVRRIRVKDAVNCVWWLSQSAWPRADNRRVLQPYSESMEDLLKKGYKAKKRPSGHDISTKFSIDNGAAIPPNLLAIPNTDSNGFYLRYCRENGLEGHPARYPSELPEFFIRMLTDPGDLVVDPFGGSCVTGEVCERVGRKWICVEMNEEYLKGALARFMQPPLMTEGDSSAAGKVAVKKNGKTYTLWRPGTLWGQLSEAPLSSDGGKARRLKPAKGPTNPQDEGHTD